MSFAHPGISRIHPIISAYRTSSFSHLGLSRHHPSIPDSLSASPPSSGSHCVNLSPCSLLLIASCDTPDKFAQSFSLLTLGTTKHPSFVHPPRTPSPLHTLQISVIIPPTVPWLPVVYLYMTFPTVFPLLPALLLPRASPMYRLISAVLAST